MGYQTWHNYGYGIRTDNIKTTADKMAELIKLAPKFAEEVRNNFIEDYETDNPTMDDYLDYDQDYMHGIGYFLREVIEEAEDVRLETVDNYDGNVFCILMPDYPWAKLTEAEKGLTEEKLDELFNKYVKILTDDVIKVEYQEVENGG